MCTALPHLVPSSRTIRNHALDVRQAVDIIFLEAENTGAEIPEWIAVRIRHSLEHIDALIVEAQAVLAADERDAYAEEQAINNLLAFFSQKAGV